MSRDAIILLAEDYDDDIALLKRAFKKAEVDRLIVVRNGDEAIDYLQGTGTFADRNQYPLPNLLLVDIKMPRRSGLEVLQWLRQQEGVKRLPVIVLTSSHNLRDINEAYDLGANSYLVKPGDFRELVQLIQNFVAYWLDLSRLPALAPG